MFQKAKNKNIEEEFERSALAEDEETVDTNEDEEANEEEDENLQDPPADEEDESENTEEYPSKKISVKQERSSDEESDDDDIDDMFEPEGELAIDVYQTDNDIVIQSAIAGVKSDDLDISVEDDIVTIRGSRKNPEHKEDKQYFHEECFWGAFSRQVFLPEEIDTKNVQATFNDGILTLRLPRIAGEKTRKVRLKKK